MNAVPLRTPAFFSLLGIAVLLSPGRAPAFSSTDGITAVSARASEDYSRVKNRDGSYGTEYYAFGEGGRWTGDSRDPSLDGLNFIDVARAVSGPLRDQNYLPTRDPKETKLLILVYWGRTRTPGGANDSEAVQNLQKATDHVASAKSTQEEMLAAQNRAASLNGPGMVCGKIQTTVDGEVTTEKMDSENAANGALAVVSAENTLRDQLDGRNAAMLGFDTALRESQGLAGTALAHRRTELIQEIEQQRYFVVLMAYDFQVLWKQKKHKLLWETRYSVPQSGLAFDQYLLAMTQGASKYFGRNSRGIERVSAPEGRVDVGDVKSLGVVMNK